MLLAVEQAVRHFSRYHKYTLSTDLRRQAMHLCRCIARASDARRVGRLLQLQHVENLVLAVDDFKLTVTLAKDLQAFRSFREFQLIAELAVAIGKQSGGWR